jgi:hypothetical protein
MDKDMLGAWLFPLESGNTEWSYKGSVGILFGRLGGEYVGKEKEIAMG